MNNILLAINITVMYSVPLIFAGLGGLFSEKVGIINIALEGIMTVGAIVSILVTYYTNNPWLGFFAAGIAGALFSLLHAISSITFRADQIISGISLNFIGPGLSLLLCKIFFDGATMSPSVPNKLPKILNWIDNKNENIWISNLNFDITVIIAFIMTAVVYFLLYKTKWGLRIIAVGENPIASATLGINVIKLRYICVIISGFITGLGGASCSLAIVSVFSATVISGRGFIALAALIFGKWTPQGTLAACLIFAFSQAIVVLLGNLNNFISSQFLNMIPYILTIFILTFFAGNSSSPKSLGVPYQNKKR